MDVSGWLTVGIFAALSVFAPLNLGKHGAPKIKEGTDLEPMSVEDVQRSYDQKFWIRQLFRFFPILLYGILIAVNEGMEDPGLDRVNEQFLVWGCATTFSILLLWAVADRYRRDRDLAARFPQIPGTFLPIQPRIISALLFLMPLSAITVMLTTESMSVIEPALLIGFAGLIGMGIYSRKAIARYQYVIPADSSLAQKIADTQLKFGFTPKKLVVSPSSTANGYALEDGTVHLTSMLLAVLSESQICAILGHELSHAKDRDARRIRNYIYLAILPPAIIATNIAITMGGHSRTWMVSLAIVGIYALRLPTLAWANYLRRKLEYKCDAAVKSIGLGTELADALARIHRFLGQPNKWKRPDSWLITHPSLDSRIRQLTNNNESIAAD